MIDSDIRDQQDAEQAIVPGAPAFIQQIVKENDKKPVSSDPDYERIMIEGATSDFWKIINKFIENKIARLQQLTSESVRGKEWSLQEVGFRYLIFDQVKGALNDVIQYVEMPTKAKQSAQQTEDKQEELGEETIA